MRDKRAGQEHEGHDSGRGRETTMNRERGLSILRSRIAVLHRRPVLAFVATAALIAGSGSAAAAGDPLQGALAFQAGMNLGSGLPDLKQANADLRVKAIGYCGDTYTVTTAGGRTRKFWEFNLRFKTDSSAHGPTKNEPVFVGQGMQGDRAQI